MRPIVFNEGRLGCRIGDDSITDLNPAYASPLHYRGVLGNPVVARTWG